MSLRKVCLLDLCIFGHHSSPGTQTNCVAGILPPWVSMAGVQRIQHELQILDVDYPAVRRYGRLKQNPRVVVCTCVAIFF